MPRLHDQAEEAHFVITGSGNGAFIVYPDQPVYTATKAAVQAVTEALAGDRHLAEAVERLTDLAGGNATTLDDLLEKS